MDKKDNLIVIILTLIYVALSFINFGNLHQNNVSWIGSAANDQLILTFNQPTEVAKVYVNYGLTTGKYHFNYIKSDGTSGSFNDKNMDNFPPHYQWANLSVDRHPIIKNLIITVDQPQIEIRQLALFDNQGDYLTNFTVHPSQISQNISKLVSIDPPADLDKTWLSAAIFDEIYYASSAYQYLNGKNPYVDVHPPLGMLLIAIGLMLFGVSPFGWRFIPNLAGIALVPVMYALSKKIFKNRKLAIAATILIMTEFMHFTISRLAFLEPILTLFIVAEYYYLYCYIETRLNGNKFAFRYLCCCAFFLGLAMATKLNALFTVPAIIIWLVYCELFKYKLSIKELIKTIFYMLLIFSIIPFAIYMLSYIPYARSQHATNIFAFVVDRFIYMFNFQVGLVNATHPYASRWWSWPLLKTPMSIYYWQDSIGKLSTSIVLMGNPALYWASIPAVIILIYNWIRKPNYVIAFILIALFAQYLPYAGIKRLSFIYYFYPVTPFLILSVVYVLKLAFEAKKKIYGYIGYCYLAICILLFILYFPVLAGLVIPRSYTVDVLWLSKNWNF